jgi:hypothetical protein
MAKRKIGRIDDERVGSGTSIHHGEVRHPKGLILESVCISISNGLRLGQSDPQGNIRGHWIEGTGKISPSGEYQFETKGLRLKNIIYINYEYNNEETDG